MDFLTILIILVCLLLCLVVLVQNSKGGGLVQGFSSQNQVMGVRKTTDFLEKATWTLAIALVVLSLATTYMTPDTVTGTESMFDDSELMEQVPEDFIPQDAASFDIGDGNAEGEPEEETK